MSVSESRTKSILFYLLIFTYTADWELHTSTEMILSNSNHLLFLLPFLLYTFPALTSRSLTSPHLSHGGPSSQQLQGPMHSCAPLHIPAPINSGALMGIPASSAELLLALETSSRQKSNILAL